MIVNSNTKKTNLLIGRLLLLCLLLGAAYGSVFSQAPVTRQPLSNLRKKWVPLKNSDTLLIDSMSIIGNTVKVLAVPDSTYTVDMINGSLIWKRRPALDSVWVTYRVLPGRMNAVTKRITYDSVMNNFIGKTYVPNYTGIGQSENFFDFGNINYSGSFGRGISFGNSQDAVVTSNLNLQLNGFLADSIEIVAAITDNNIPIQPDGTTQQLNEFDRIFLQFRKKTWSLSLGDIDIRQNESYFLSFYKRLQGIAFETNTAISPTVNNKTMVSGSIAKGKFTRNILPALEGNQGPYRLQGANNEFFFVILANTERVYIDGVLMQRGEDQDYVINYNTAEITFTPRNMITKDKRIQVEFEYSDRNYLNANLYAYNETNFNEKVKLRVSAFSNSDSKNSPINQTVDAPQKTFLNNIGDSINRAFFPSAILDTFVAGSIMYKKVDTILANGQSDTAFVFSTNPDSARYQLSFIDVGPGNGDYIPDFNGANGKVYRWIAPVGGVRQGNFLPAVYLVTPKKQQVFSMGIDYNLSKNTVITSEAAMSVYDVNTFASKDKSNDQGYAAKIGIKNNKMLRESNGLNLQTVLGYEYVDSRFKPLERLRNVEFTRDWGLPLVVQAADETIVNASTQLGDRKGNYLKYQFTTYNRGKQFTGIRNSLFQYQDIRGWKLNNQLNYSNINSSTDQGYFLRPTFDVSRKFPALKNYSIAFNYALEHNELRNKNADTVTATSFSFYTFKTTVRSNEAKPNKWSIAYFTRTDQYPFGKDLARSDRSQNVNLTAEILQNEHHQFRFTGTYRNLKILNSAITTQRPDNSLLGRAEYQVNEFKGLLTGNLLYELGAGQEQKRDFAYLEVPAGQGEFTWIDYNQDGIQQLNEFEVALFQDQAKYIRIFTPSNDFVKASYNTFNYSISLNPRAAINKSTANGMGRFVSRINLQSSLQISKKEVSDGLVQFNPFRAPLNDTSLITLNSSFINTFSFNRFSSKWGIDLNNAVTSNKSLLTYGYESRMVNNWSLKGRVNITRNFLFDVTGQQGVNELITTNSKFGSRNYNIDIYAVEPRLSYTRGANMRVIVGYRMSDKQNKGEGGEQALSSAFNGELKYNILQSTSIQTKFTYNNITFSGKDPSGLNTNSPAAYIMLDGLLPGKNFLWNVELSKRLNNNLEINIQYEGRKPGEARTVHVGRASIRALL
ncbi:MAG: hypothetical protein ABW036_07140, partial [Flavitalea sp.]